MEAVLLDPTDEKHTERHLVFPDAQPPVRVNLLPDSQTHVYDYLGNGTEFKESRTDVSQGVLTALHACLALADGSNRSLLIQERDESPIHSVRPELLSLLRDE